MNTFWDVYYKKPLSQIPWQNTQADWFKELVDSGEISGETAVDLGCGTGMKSIYLAENTNFKEILGIDISKQAIAYAKENAQKSKESQKLSFKAGNILDWKTDKKFDLILDWARLHCLKPGEYQRYVDQVNAHSKPGTRYLLRTFSTEDDLDYFEEYIDGMTERIFYLDGKKIRNLFLNFEIRKIHRSKPRTKNSMFFQELLLGKK